MFIQQGIFAFGWEPLQDSVAGMLVLQVPEMCDIRRSFQPNEKIPN